MNEKLIVITFTTMGLHFSTFFDSGEVREKINCIFQRRSLICKLTKKKYIISKLLVLEKNSNYCDS